MPAEYQRSFFYMNDGRNISFGKEGDQYILQKIPHPLQWFKISAPNKIIGVQKEQILQPNAPTTPPLFS